MSPLGFLLVVAMAAVALVLLTGIVGFAFGGEFNRRYGNRLMRARVMLQFVAVILLGLLFLSQ